MYKIIREVIKKWCYHIFSQAKQLQLLCLQQSQHI